MGISSKIRTIFRGDVRFVNLPQEALRRRKAVKKRKVERGNLGRINKSPARLTPEFGSLTPAELLVHFRERKTTFFGIGGADERDRIAKLQSELFPVETGQLIESATRIVRHSNWELAGFGPLEFNVENVWRCDPLSGKDWSVEFHADIEINKQDGSDIRVLWELNRFGHAITLARAYVMTNDEAYAETFFSHLEGWVRQNLYGLGANWSCAMEVAIRAINLLAAFDIFRRSEACSEERLTQLLQLFDQHGRFILDNNEFSYISTSNHYLSNVVGLFWIGTLLPELKLASEWKEFGLSEMLREADVQILPDGADFEASTGYHKFVTEMLLYSFLLAKREGLDIPEKSWDRLRQMLEYIRGIIRPDGRVPLIGDADGSQIIPLVKRDADDQSYLLALGCVVFDQPNLKVTVSAPPEILWILGDNGINSFESIEVSTAPPVSTAFPQSGAYIMREGDLYLHFNANDCGMAGRGSHGHNDALSIEISAFGRPFIVDPGSYVYNLDRPARQMFRSTAFHSTVMLDGREQNTTDAERPFVMGNEARPDVIEWQSNTKRDRVSAEHFGYSRLPNSIRHRRTVELNKIDRYWLIEDRLMGKGEHEFSFAFHVSPGLTVGEIDDATIKISDDADRNLYIRAIGIDVHPQIMPANVSRNYGHREESSILKWTLTAPAPLVGRFFIVPSGPDAKAGSGLELLDRLTENID
jgi:hypothetical protein